MIGANDLNTSIENCIHCFVN